MLGQQGVGASYPASVCILITVMVSSLLCSHVVAFELFVCFPVVAVHTKHTMREMCGARCDMHYNALTDAPSPYTYMHTHLRRGRRVYRVLAHWPHFASGVCLARAPLAASSEVFMRGCVLTSLSKAFLFCCMHARILASDTLLYKGLCSELAGVLLLPPNAVCCVLCAVHTYAFTKRCIPMGRLSCAQQAAADGAVLSAAALGRL